LLAALALLLLLPPALAAVALPLAVVAPPLAPVAPLLAPPLAPLAPNNNNGNDLEPSNLFLPNFNYDLASLPPPLPPTCTPSPSPLAIAILPPPPPSALLAPALALINLV